MGRRHQHEEHVNHEAWAIPYGDLVTLLLAFFVVMYAVSSINEGKYRVLADAMSSAFGGPPRSIAPVQLGKTQLRGSSFDRPSLQTAAAKTGPASISLVTMVRVRQRLDMPTYSPASPIQGVSERRAASVSANADGKRERQLSSLGEKIRHALDKLVRQNLVVVRRRRTFVEVEIQSDILFASGQALPSDLATSTVRQLAAILREAPNALRVEGYTDDRPISTTQFPSNWELSSARASAVTHVLVAEGVAPQRIAVVGHGEYQPIADNSTEAGRNANRRVLLVILAAPLEAEVAPARDPMLAVEPDAPLRSADQAALPDPGHPARPGPNTGAAGEGKAVEPLGAAAATPRVPLP